ADSSQAPPGDYLLFLVNNHGVPSIGQWLRVGSSWPSGDNMAPYQIGDLQVSTSTSAGFALVCSASGDDGIGGTASYADVRYSFTPITTESGWNSAHRVSPEPVPACAGRQMVFGVGGLQPCRDYYFAIKLGDESGNWSTLSINNPMGSTLCSDCCTVGER